MTQANRFQIRAHTVETLAAARQVLADVEAGAQVLDAIRHRPLPGGGYLSKSMLVEAYHKLAEEGELAPDPHLLSRIRMKPVRTLSGVTTVTVLTKPYPCPGKCIFCPDDVRMPKSYLPDEPGAARALQHNFDPFDQVTSRIQALEATGHPTDKIELLILGGTWSSYRRDYQEWFVRRCFDALNRFEAATLPEAQRHNETAAHRNVGLVIETRPDHVDAGEIAWLRYLGVTKIQMGAQSLDDPILSINRRGHTLAETTAAVTLLRAAGFKIALHWMPNLLGATPDSDCRDFSRLWDRLCPDEIKIYPTQLLEGTELYNFWLRGEYQPYTTEQLVLLLADIKETIPSYCRVNRVIRDIPSTHVVAGNKRTSLRQDAQLEMQRRGTRCRCIRCREVRAAEIHPGQLEWAEEVYQAGEAEEHFISFVTPEEKLAGFVRLSLPGAEAPDVGIPELAKAAIIREVHVYGQSLGVGKGQTGAAQHIGLGTRLLQRAEQVARQHGYGRLAVISAVGTRRYYLKRGFRRGELYLVKDL